MIPLLDRARAVLDHWMPGVEQTWLRVPACRLQPCLRDIWHDHVLFEGEQLTGLIDYAAVGLDTPATDLARLLGSLVEDDPEQWRLAIAAYRERAPLSAEEEELARKLERTGVVVAVFHWVQKLTAASGPARPEVVARLDRLVDRIFRWEMNGARRM
jgi:homoserine kinase type II